MRFGKRRLYWALGASSALTLLSTLVLLLSGVMPAPGYMGLVFSLTPYGIIVFGILAAALLFAVGGPTSRFWAGTTIVVLVSWGWASYAVGLSTEAAMGAPMFVYFVSMISGMLLSLGVIWMGFAVSARGLRHERPPGAASTDASSGEP